MKRSIVCLAISLFIAGSAVAEDAMVERMQSVIDEVSELRLRYEACSQKVQEKDEMIDNFSKKGFDSQTYREKSIRIQELEFENQQLKESQEEENKRLLEQIKARDEEVRTLKANVKQQKNTLEKINETQDNTKSSENKKIKALEEENKIYKKKNAELTVNLKSKEEDLLAIIASVEKKARSLRESNTRLENELNQLQSKQLEPSNRKIKCPNDNPFPKLMMKNKEVKSENAASVQSGSEDKSAGAYRMKRESAVYDAPEGKLISLWEERRSFTSNLTQGEWIKITGYFVDKKWQRAKEALWVKRENTIKR